jgi:hypothetical protein
MHGLGHSIAVHRVGGFLTVGLKTTDVKRDVIPKKKNCHAVLDHQTWSPIARAERHVYLTSPINRGSPAQTLFQIAPSFANGHSLVDTNVPGCVTLANVCLAC